MLDNRKDINVEFRVRNNLILKKMRGRGIPTVSELSRQLKATPSRLGELVNMKEPARKEDGSWIPLALKLAEFFQCMPEDLFSDRQQHKALKKNRREAEISYAEMQQLTSRAPDKQLEASSEALQLKMVLMLALNKLTPREERILRMRFGMNLSNEISLAEVGEKFGVLGERIRQIEAKALRKLKHPAYLARLREVALVRGPDYVSNWDGGEHRHSTFGLDNDLMEALALL